MRHLVASFLFLLIAAQGRSADSTFRAGAAAVDVTPERFPVAVNCGFAEAQGTAARDKLHARALVLDDGSIRLAIVVVDSCMMPREFLDAVKDAVALELNIPAERQLIAATHTHTAPAVMGCLGSDPDPNYGPFLQRQIVQAVRQANARLTPAVAGWSTVDAGTLTNNRRWILRSDRIRNDPFGHPTVRANMHPGYLNADFVGPSGPIDPWLTLCAIRSTDGQPLATLSNFSMHYFGTPAVSADYFGKVCAILEQRLGSGFVAIHSQGTSGDLHWMDYGRPAANPGIDAYAESVAEKIHAALEKATDQPNLRLAMAETKLTLGRRVPDAPRLEWAKPLVAALKGAKPTRQPDIYAREALYLAAEPRRELKLQAIRIGELGIAAIPNEVYAITGLKIKAQSPLRTVFSIELANGAEGYIPPAEQHALGGYTTWPARTAGLEIAAEARITETVLQLLERVAGRKRLSIPEPFVGAYPEQVLASKPVRYWRLGELTGPGVRDSHGGAATAEPGIVFGLDGPLPSFDGIAATNRAAHFAGGRIRAELPAIGDRYSLEVWFWNGFPADAREWTGTLATLAAGSDVIDTLAFGGRKGNANALAANATLFGKTAVGFRRWHHAVLVRDRDRVRIYLNGRLEADGNLPRSGKPDTLVIGGRPDRTFGWEGRLAEVALHPRALAETEIADRVRLAQGLVSGTNGTKIVAHRGLFRHAPENTLANFRACRELRLGFEFDVRRTKDGHLVCLHDESVNRTTDGKGRVAEMTLEEIRRLDAGRWFDSRFAGEKVPTIDEIFELIAGYGTQEALFAVDLKAEAVERDLVKLAEKHGVLNRLLFIGRTIENADVRDQLKRAARGARTAVVANREGEFAAALSAANGDWVYFRYLPSAEQMAAVRAAGKRAFIAGTTVAGNLPENWRKALHSRIDGLLTDYPLELSAQMRAKP